MIPKSVYKEDEFRGALTHLREISPSEVQKVIKAKANGVRS
jgi:hypothetical protein